MSCSTYVQNDRSIAEEISSPLTTDELLTFKSTPNFNPQVGLKEKINTGISGFFMNGFAVEYVEDQKMPSDIAFKLRPVFKEQNFTIQVIHSANGLNDVDAVNELLKFLKVTYMGNSGDAKLLSKYSFYELFYNTTHNDIPSLHNLTKMRSMADPANSEWSNALEEFKTPLRIYNKKVKTQENSRKAVMDSLDKLPDNEQFRNLVAKNDRKGAAELIRSYLPWEQMPPFEKKFWENHLAVLADPLPITERVMIYRGIDDDIIQLAQEAGQTISKEEALKEHKIFLMSTMMTKNQGSWNRRLRSLTAMYDKYIANDTELAKSVGGTSEFTKSSRISTMFFKHSKEPNGSPFLSYSPKAEIVNSFGKKRMTSYLIDPRAMYFNYASAFQTELEFLVPLVTFPEDIAALWQAGPDEGEPYFTKVNAKLEYFDSETVKKLDRELGAGKGVAALEAIKKNSEAYFSSVKDEKYAFIKPLKGIEPSPSVYKTTLGMSADKVSPKLKTDSNLKCVDIIQMFWK